MARVRETETIGLKVPVVFEVSPYYGGSVDDVNWNVDHEIGQPPTTRPVTAPVFFDTSPIISNSHVSTWVPRGFAVVHAEGTGTGLSEGCPTTGDPFETLGPKAVVDWLVGGPIEHIKFFRMGEFQIAGLSEQVQVEGHAAVVETSSTTVANTVSNTEIAKLPLGSQFPTSRNTYYLGTLLTDGGGRWPRWLKWLAEVGRNPGNLIAYLASLRKQMEAQSS